MQRPGTHPSLPPPLARVLEGYREGAFLMAVGPGERRPGLPARRGPAWYEADPRGIIRLDPPKYHIPRRLARTVRSGRFQITSDQAFGAVLRACADPRRRGGWIDTHITSIFEAFHDHGLAHSIEAWTPLPLALTHPDVILGLDKSLIDTENDRLLVGGLYGLRVGCVFCAESMFSRPDLGGRDASKVCLALAIEHCRKRGFKFIDTQLWTEHLSQFGCEEVRRTEYRQLLDTSRNGDCEWGEFEIG